MMIREVVALITELTFAADSEPKDAVIRTGTARVVGLLERARAEGRVDGARAAGLFDGPDDCACLCREHRKSACPLCLTVERCPVHQEPVGG